MKLNDLRQVEAPASHLIDAYEVVDWFRTLLIDYLEMCGCNIVPHFFYGKNSLVNDESVTKIYGGGWLLAKI